MKFIGKKFQASYFSREEKQLTFAGKYWIIKVDIEWNRLKTKSPMLGTGKDWQWVYSNAARFSDFISQAISLLWWMVFQPTAEAVC